MRHLLWLCLLISTAHAADFLRPSPADPRPLWGIPGGIRFSIAPASVEGDDFGGPRGLIRIGYPAVGPSGYILMNFIAIEPVVGLFHRKGYSELERSPSDGLEGKRLWVLGSAPPGTMDPGLETTGPDGVKRLHVRINCERFENGAHVYVVATLRADRPDEVHFTVHALPDSAPLKQCILTATMGNKARVRDIFLGQTTLNSKALWPRYRGSDFARDVFSDDLPRDPAGDVVVPFRGDEPDPAAVHPFPNDPLAWYYPGRRLTQYWKKPAGSPQRDLHLRANGRYTYWMSAQPIPGGIAFENVELRDSFSEGEAWIFGITDRTPQQVLAGEYPTPALAGLATSLLGVPSAR